MGTTGPDRRSLAAASAGLDALTVFVFVALGRDTHDEGFTIEGIVETAAPFLLAVVAGWIVWRAWRKPLGLRTGAMVAATTVVVGLALRRLVFDDGTALTFILVTTAFIGSAMAGWRAVGRRVVASLSARSDSRTGGS